MAIAAGAGMSHEEIAVALGISRNTLEKHFEHDLSVGAYQRRMEVLAAMHAAAKKGNVAACKAYIAMTPNLAAPPTPDGDSKPAAKAPPIGKKAQAQEGAKTAHLGTDWADLLDRPALPQ